MTAIFLQTGWAIYLVIMAAAVGLALWLPATAWRKAGWTAAGVACLLLVPGRTPLCSLQSGPLRDAVCHALPTGPATQARERAQLQMARAREMFEQRCKTSGEKIRRTVTDVEGILLLKVRPGHLNSGEQFALDDPYGNDLGGNGYIGSFIKGSYQSPREPDSPPWLFAGYRYVDVIDAADGKRYRYTGRIEEPWLNDKSYLKGHTRFVLDKAPAPGPAPRYGVTYDDISTREEREHWIAGSSLRVVDLGTNEVIAERIGYMMDPGQGNDSGGRSPWLMAADTSCPQFRPPHAAASQHRQTQKFVLKVLISKGGE